MKFDKQTTLILTLLTLLGFATYVIVVLILDMNYLFYADGDKMDPVLVGCPEDFATCPVSASDYISVETPYGRSDPIRAGDDIFGYLAPLESYIPIYRLRWEGGGGCIESWITTEFCKTYYVPVFDTDGSLVMSFYAVREYYGFSAWRNDEAYAAYLSAKEQLERHFHRRNVDVNDYRIILSHGMNILIAETDVGIYGMVYLLHAGTALQLRREGLRLNSVRRAVLCEQKLLEVIFAERKR